MKPHDEWLYKAEHDIQSAEYLQNADTPLYDVAIYHTQQCAEKALKAFLAYHLKEIEKIHNLIMLNQLCSDIDNDFDELEEDVIFLNPYATLYRYPEGELLPSKKSLSQAIDKAKNIFRFVANKMSINEEDKSL